jgi:hypothetical protein
MRVSLVLILYLISTMSAMAQTTKPIKWAFSISKTELKQGDAEVITMKAEISPDWYLYSSDFNPDLGPTVTSILFDIDDSYQVVGPLKPIGAKEKYDALWEGYVRYFVGTAEFKQELKILRKDPVIKARIYYQVCNDKVGKCIPYEEAIYFDNIQVAPGVLPTLPKEDSIKAQELKSITTETKKKTNLITENETKRISPTLKELEEAKEKLINKDSDGNDLSVKQLKTFVQKYGGSK